MSGAAIRAGLPGSDSCTASAGGERADLGTVVTAPRPVCLDSHGLLPAKSAGSHREPYLTTIKTSVKVDGRVEAHLLT
jgi:hypothetical protein